MRETPVCPTCGTDHPGVLTGDLCPACGALLTGRAAGATVTLRKPADAETIVTTLAQLLDRRADRPAL